MILAKPGPRIKKPRRPLRRTPLRRNTKPIARVSLKRSRSKRGPILAHVERDETGMIAVVLSNCHKSSCPLQGTEHVLRKTAVAEIRHRVFEKYNYLCAMCGNPVTEQDAEMDEELARGSRGEDGMHGKISIYNSRPLHKKCHSEKHGNRNVRWSVRRKP